MIDFYPDEYVAYMNDDTVVTFIVLLLFHAAGISISLCFHRNYGAFAPSARRWSSDTLLRGVLILWGLLVAPAFFAGVFIMFEDCGYCSYTSPAMSDLFEYLKNLWVLYTITYCILTNLLHFLYFITSKTPLITASAFGYSMAVRYLIARGSDLNLQDPDGLTPLHWAAFSGERKVIALLLKAGTKPDTRDNKGRTPLHIAAMQGHGDCIELLCKTGIPVDVRDTGGNTPLHLAAIENKADAVRMLLFHQADPTILNRAGVNALTCTALFGYFKPALHLVTANPELLVLEDSRGFTPLSCALHRKHYSWFQYFSSRNNLLEPHEMASLPLVAVTMGNRQAVDYLLSLKEPGKFGFPDVSLMLHKAVSNLQTGMTLYLLVMGMSPNGRNHDGNTPFHMLAGLGNFPDRYSRNKQKGDAWPILKLLRAWKGDINARNNEGLTPLHIAVLAKNQATIESLVHHGADIDTQDYYGATPLVLALELLNPVNKKDTINIIRHLLYFCADTGIPDNKGRTPFHLAAAQEDELIFHDLRWTGRCWIAQGKQTRFHKQKNTNRGVLLAGTGEIPLKMCDMYGNTLLHHAAAGGSANLVKIILEAGIDANEINNRGETPLHLASHPDCAQVLCEQGVDISARNNYGQTPLHLAARDGNWTVVCHLLFRTAEVNLRDEEGYTPLHLAALRGHEYVVRLLLDKGADTAIQNNRSETATFLAEWAGYGLICDIIKNHCTAGGDETFQIIGEFLSPVERLLYEIERSAMIR